MISHQTPAPFPLITQLPTPSLLQISHTVFCLNPAKTVSFPRNLTSPDLPGSVWITSHQLSTQAISARNVFKCSVTSARGSCPPSKDSPSAAEPPRAFIEQLELEGLVEVVASEVKLTADEGARGTAINKGGEDLGQVIKSDIDDKQLCGPQAELQRSPELAVCDTSNGGGVAIKELEEDQSGEASEALGSKHCQGFVDKVIHGTAINQCGDGVVREGESDVEEEGGGGVGGEVCWEVVWGKYHCTEKWGQGKEDVGV
ncbi:hypothetical protein E4T56_gene11364 [Termitomyces sp. T112]|nr:hypothetical protein E4T56_gene11364 [Termitomyces sp. T112]